MTDPAPGDRFSPPTDPVPRCRGARIAFFGGSFDPPHLGHLAIARPARAALNLDRVLFAPVGAQPLKPSGSTAPFADRLAMTELAIAREPGFEISLADAPHAAGQPNYTLETLRRLHAGLPPEGRLFCLMGADSFASLRHWRGAAEIPFAAALIVASRPGQNLDGLARYLPQGLSLDRPSEPALLPEGASRIAQDKVLGKAADRDTSPVGAEEPRDDSRRSEPKAGGESGDVPIDCRSYLIRDSSGATAPFYVLPDLDVEISASQIRAQVRASSLAAACLPPRVAEYIRKHTLYR